MINIEYNKSSDTMIMERTENKQEGLLGEHYLGHGIFVSYNTNFKISRARIPFFRKTYLRVFGNMEILLELEEDWLEKNLPPVFSGLLIDVIRRNNKRVF